MGKRAKTYNLLRYIAMLGNLIFILWIIYNGIDEGFSDNSVMIFSYIGLIVLLILNIALLYRQRNI
jgi:hypothetical protein